MARTIGIGNQDFETIRKEGYFYVDKTHFIRQWWESGDNVTLITRPRRFGKTFFLLTAKTVAACLRGLPSGIRKTTEKYREPIQ